MNNKLECPVCGYKEIEGDSCPNCDTDLTLIWRLCQLSEVRTSAPTKIQAWQFVVIGFVFLIGLGIGTISSFLFIQPQSINATVNVPNPVIVVPTPSTPAVLNTPPKTIQPATYPATYTVQSGDNLSIITEKLCGQGASWQLMVQANPQLKGRENDIEKGEVFKVPNCQEAG
ncbi:hypothetical protein DSM106972_085980 [Dulcicalothrix desertica PCC 7102]|uniref:LysM domain-containing protein n=1 Tax=Dulcicalothrix desertica PCC 7102 TaxID=232991 RepID=A0A3S1C4U8_9CYAN|nr:LysM peptidoglycan-binding domain-containing protein [Dulcicalothrix desertica]RUS97048.1 hypothetical protein DSM106972_085980 [Dulcicalothrix desertica PCC 7102]TWH54021.1 LysM domain-containing protein [Dulcicalothrix desertica PCC 7102]